MFRGKNEIGDAKIDIWRANNRKPNADDSILSSYLSLINSDYIKHSTSNSITTNLFEGDFLCINFVEDTTIHRLEIIVVF